MPSFVGRHKKLTAVVIVVAACVALLFIWPLTAATRGRLMAEIDVHRGHYEVQTYGLLAGWSPEYSRLLQERYGVHERVVAGCMVSESMVAYVHAYNQVSMAAANRKFGKDVFAECAAEAKNTWIKAHTSVPEE